MSIKDVHKMSIKSTGKTERRRAILEKIEERKFFTLKAIAEELGVTLKTIYRDMKELKKSKKIRFVGPKRGGHYEMGNK